MAVCLLNALSSSSSDACHCAWARDTSQNSVVTRTPSQFLLPCARDLASVQTYFSFLVAPPVEIRVKITPGTRDTFESTFYNQVCQQRANC